MHRTANETFMEFRRASGFGWRIGVCIACASVFLGLQCVVFLGSDPVLTEADKWKMVGGGVLGLLGLYLLWLAASYLRRPVRVTLDHEGLLLEGIALRRWVSWTEVSSFTGVDVGGGDSLGDAKWLELCDDRGRVLARIYNDIGEFRRLVAEIQLRAWSR